MGQFLRPLGGHDPRCGGAVRLGLARAVPARRLAVELPAVNVCWWLSTWFIPGFYGLVGQDYAEGPYTRGPLPFTTEAEVWWITMFAGVAVSACAVLLTLSVWVLSKYEVAGETRD